MITDFADGIKKNKRVVHFYDGMRCFIERARHTCDKVELVLRE